MTVDASAWLTRHGVHALVLVGPVAAFAVVALVADGRAWLRKRGIHREPTLVLAATLSAGAAAVHVAVCPEHFHEALIYGTFMAAAASAQLGWAFLVMVAGRRWLVVAGLGGNLAMTALWLLTRTVGVPLGPGAGEVETIGALDLVATTCELGVIACCAWVLLRSRARARLQPA
jgi:hypothetical protein